MPIIATGDYALHIRLKKYVADHPGWSIGRTIEEFTKFCLDAGVGELNAKEKVKVKEIIKQVLNE